MSLFGRFATQFESSAPSTSSVAYVAISLALIFALFVYLNSRKQEDMDGFHKVSKNATNTKSSKVFTKIFAEDNEKHSVEGFLKV
jgi:hypothetical protein